VDAPALVRQGLLITPKLRASVSLDADRLTLRDGPDELSVPRSAIRGATLIFHDMYDRIPGIDDVLRVHLDGCPDLLVASSTGGFEELALGFDRNERLVREGIG
jgi:hypothetical protein